MRLETARILLRLRLPRELAEFDNAIFTGCTSLNNINVSAGNEKYQSKDGVVFDADGTTLVYYSSSRKAESYTVPAGVTEIGAKAFYQNTYLKEVILPDGLSVINHTAFRGCTALEKINIPNTVTLIDDAAFYGCSALKTVEFEEGGTLPLVIGVGKKSDRKNGEYKNTGQILLLGRFLQHRFAQEFDTARAHHLDWRQNLL